MDDTRDAPPVEGGVALRTHLQWRWVRGGEEYIDDD
jgi:hypothetical protein